MFYFSVSLSGPQKVIAMTAEMIHTASLVHDDVIDTAETRRGKPTVQKLWGQKKVALKATTQTDTRSLYCNFGLLCWIKHFSIYQHFAILCKVFELFNLFEILCVAFV